MTSSSRKRWLLRRFLADRFIHRFPLPTGRLVLLVAAGAVLSAAAYAAGPPYGRSALILWNALLLLLAAFDYMLLPQRREFAMERSAPKRVDVKQPFEVRLKLLVRRPLTLQIAMKDDWPIEFRQSDIRGRLQGSGVTLTYSTASAERGLYELQYVYLLYWGGLGLVRKYARLECPGVVRIVPDLSQVRGILGSTPSSLLLDGHQVYKKAGAGSDFDSIRDYVQGDDPRTVNWRATARTGKLMTSVLQPEKGKIVTIVLDCGRMMGVELEGQTKLDRTLESALALAAVALRQGDRVALLAFAAELKVYVPPDNGLAHLNRLVDAVYDLRSEMAESSFSVALTYLLRVQKKRSLVVLFSDMESYLYHQDAAAYMRKLRRSHLMLLLSLQDPLLQKWARAEVTNARTGFIQSLAHKFRSDRSRYVQTMAMSDIAVLDVPTDKLTLSAVQAYLDMKSRDAL